MEEAKEAVKKTSRRLKCTAYPLIVAGVIGVVASFWRGFNASKRAHDIVSRGLIGEEQEAAPAQPQGEEQFMLRDEFVLYDTFKNVSMVTFVMSIIVLAIGRSGLTSARWQSLWWTRKMSKCCFLFTALLVLLGLFCAHQISTVKDIIHQYKPSPHSHHGRHGGHGEGRHWGQAEQEEAPAEEDEVDGNYDATGQNGAEKKLFGFFGWNQDSSKQPSCGYVRGADICNAREDCAWCEGHTAPSHCTSVDHAQELDQTYIFGCAKTKRTEDQEPVPKEECGWVRDTNICNSQDNCVWCKGIGAPSYCVSTDHAQDLIQTPIFLCDLAQKQQKPAPSTPATPSESPERVLATGESSDPQGMEKIMEDTELFVEKTRPDLNPEEAKAVEQPVLQDDPGCSSVTVQDQCDAAQLCTWCVSNQQPPACFSLTSSVGLPQKIYQCDKQPQISVEEPVAADDTKESEAPDAAPSAADSEEPWHHGHHGHGWKHGHEHGEGPGPHGHGGRGPHHGGKGRHHGGRHHGKCCCAIPAGILGLLLLVHAYNQRTQIKALQKLEELKKKDGTASSWGCGGRWKKRNQDQASQGREQPQPAPARPVQVVESPPLIQKSEVVATSPSPVFDYSLCEHEPSTVQTTQNDMV